MKRILLVSILSINYIFSATITPLPDVSPATIEFAWDMHNTLMQKFVPETALFLTPGQKLLIRKINKLFRQTQNNEKIQAIKKIIEQSNPGLWHIAEQLSGYHYPSSGIIALIHELHELGYTQRLASNVSAVELEKLKDRFPKLFTYLKGGQTVIFDGSAPRIKKPNPRYFEQFQKTYNPQASKTIIFIDEKAKNTKVATQQGMYGITFKNTQQLKEELKRLGIPLQ